MIDWLYRRRDPAAAGTSLVLLALVSLLWRHVPSPGAATQETINETVVRMEEVPPPPPPPPVPPPPSPRPPDPQQAAPVPIRRDH